MIGFDNLIKKRGYLLTLLFQMDDYSNSYVRNLKYQKISTQNNYLNCYFGVVNSQLLL